MSTPITRPGEMATARARITRPDRRKVDRQCFASPISSYEGEIWRLPLSTAARTKLKQKRFFDWCLHQEGKPYDTPQAVKSALDALDNVPITGGATYNIEDFSKFFCWELVAAALKKGGVIKKINASEVTSIDLCRFNLYSGVYSLFKGPKKRIGGYNTQNPEGFGM